MSVITFDVNNPVALSAGADEVGLTLDTSGQQPWDYSPFLHAGEVDPTPPGRQVGVLRMRSPGPVCGFNRLPAAVGVFEKTIPGGEDGEELVGFTLAWDDFRDGWGLGSRIGPNGAHLKTAIALVETSLAAERLDLDRRVVAYGNGTVRVTLSQRGDQTMKAPVEVVIEIDQTGKVTTEVNGCTGSGCENLTKAIEDALGTVESTERKQEFYKPVPQTVKAGLAG